MFSTHEDIHLPDPITIKGITWKEAGKSTAFGSLLVTFVLGKKTFICLLKVAFMYNPLADQI